MSEIRFWRAVMSLLVLGLALGLLVYTWNVLLPFVFGVVIAYLIDPLVDRFVARGLRRDRVVLVLYAFFLCSSVLLGTWLIPTLMGQLNEALTNLPAYGQQLNALIATLNQDIQKSLSSVLGERAAAFKISFQAGEFLEMLFRGVSRNIMDVAHAGLWVFIVPFVSFFVLKESRTWIDHLFDWTPSEYVESLLGFFAEVNSTLGGYIRGVLLESMGVGILTILGLLALGINGAVLIGFVTMLLNVVPLLALFVGGAIAVLAGYMQGASTSIIFGIVVLYLIIRLIDDFVLIPFVMGQTVRLHPVVILFAILAGVQLAGFIGLVFAIPLAAVVKTILSIILIDKRKAFFSAKQHVYS